MRATRKQGLGSRFFSALRVLAPWMAVGCVLLALSSRTGELKTCLGRISVGWLVLSFSLGLLYRFLNAGIWAWILGALGHPLPYVRAMRAWLTSESLRWLPGSVWGFCSRVDDARNLGVPSVVASLSLPVELTLTVVSWGIVASAGLLASGPGGRFLTSYGYSFVSIGVAVVTTLVAFGIGWPLLVQRAWIRKRLERAQVLLKLRSDAGQLICSGLFYTALNAVNGLGFWLVLAGMGYRHAVSPTLAVGVNGAGWLMGFFALGVPGGIGVREAGAALLLTPNLSWQEAALAAVLWRAVQIATELAGLLPWLLIGNGRTASAEGVLAEKVLSPKGTEL